MIGIAAQRFAFANLPYGLWRCVSTGSTTRAGVDFAWEQEKLEARKVLENRAESHSRMQAVLGGVYLLWFLHYHFNESTE
jgi:hypothetical protein